jgi:murein DD-endopeptidase MepM/ murein hydrolase activator NlpD
MVTVRHDNGYLTKYLHLSRMAIKSGARVDQGDVIGYVGSTGLSTGPHLDFRIFKNNKAVNPLKVISPPGLPISRARFDDFAALRDKRIDELRLTKDDSRLARR